MTQGQREALTPAAQRLVKELSDLHDVLQWLVKQITPPWGQSDPDHRDLDWAVMQVHGLRRLLVKVFHIEEGS